MSVRFAITLISTVLSLGAGLVVDARAVPVTYSFSGEMTTFLPPVSDPGVIPPVPAELKFFSGSFDYDAAAAPDAAIANPRLEFADSPQVDGPLLVPLGEPVTFARARIVEDFDGTVVLAVQLSARDLTEFSRFSIFLQRPVLPTDEDGVLPTTVSLDEFSGSFITASLFSENFFLRGSLDTLGPRAVAMPEPGTASGLAAMVLLVAAAAGRRIRCLARRGAAA